MSPEADLHDAVRELATTAASTLRGAIGAPGHVEEAPPGPVHVRASHLVVLVPATGDLAGVTWVLPIAAVTALARKLAPARPTDIDASACELANILTGRACATLELCGVRVELSAPRVVGEVTAGASACVGSDLGTLTVLLHARAAAAA